MLHPCIPNSLPSYNWLINLLIKLNLYTPKVQHVRLKSVVSHTKVEWITARLHNWPGTSAYWCHCTGSRVPQQTPSQWALPSHSRFWPSNMLWSVWPPSLDQGQNQGHSVESSKRKVCKWTFDALTAVTESQVRRHSVSIYGHSIQSHILSTICSTVFDLVLTLATHSISSGHFWPPERLNVPYFHFPYAVELENAPAGNFSHSKQTRDSNPTH